MRRFAAVSWVLAVVLATGVTWAAAAGAGPVASTPAGEVASSVVSPRSAGGPVPLPGTYTGHSDTGARVTLTYEHDAVTWFRLDGVALHHHVPVHHETSFADCVALHACVAGTWVSSGTIRGTYENGTRHTYTVHSDHPVPDPAFGHYRGCLGPAVDGVRKCMELSYDGAGTISQLAIWFAHHTSDFEAHVRSYRITPHCDGHVCLRGRWLADDAPVEPDRELHAEYLVQPHGHWHPVHMTRVIDDGPHFGIYHGHDDEGTAVRLQYTRFGSLGVEGLGEGGLIHAAHFVRRLTFHACHGTHVPDEARACVSGRFTTATRVHGQWWRYGSTEKHHWHARL